ncbi:MAG: hypothetical protein U0Z53_23640 [Blastocatellia bacterium]
MGFWDKFKKGVAAAEPALEIASRVGIPGAQTADAVADAVTNAVTNAAPESSPDLVELRARLRDLQNRIILLERRMQMLERDRR